MGYGRADSGLGDFLKVMYQKRELEYTAALNKYKAEVEGAKSLGEGIGALGQGISKGIGGYMDQSVTNKVGAQAFGDQWMGGGTRELDVRSKIAEMSRGTEMTPYQQSQAELGNQRLEAYIARTEAMQNQEKEAKSRAAEANESKKFKERVGDMDSYQAKSDENMTKLYAADNPEVFETHRRRQVSLNEGAMASGISPDRLVQVPSDFIPPKQRKAYEFYQYQQQFGQGTTNPQEMARRREAATTEGSVDVPTAGGDVIQQPAVSYGTGPGQQRPPTMSTGIPPGSVSDPNFRGPKGSTANNGNMIWNGQFWVPRQHYQ